jgi:hypothetical protein
LLPLVKLKFLVVFVELKSPSGAGKVENLFVIINKSEISLQLLIKLKSFDGVSKTIKSFSGVGRPEIFLNYCWHNYFIIIIIRSKISLLLLTKLKSFSGVNKVV